MTWTVGGKTSGDGTDESLAQGSWRGFFWVQRRSSWRYHLPPIFNLTTQSNWLTHALRRRLSLVKSPVLGITVLGI